MYIPSVGSPLVMVRNDGIGISSKKSSFLLFNIGKDEYLKVSWQYIPMGPSRTGLSGIIYSLNVEWDI